MVFELAAHKILSDLKTGNYRLSVHALDMMAARKLIDADIIRIAETCHKFDDLGEGIYRIVGTQLNGKGIAAVCKIEDNTVIITIMKRRINKRYILNEKK